jgi:group II intron reverse transcriptase/maturase
VSLLPPETVWKLQKALHAKAKASPAYRFYALYDKVYRDDVLLLAYRRCKANGGAMGVDRQRFEDIESYGRDPWLSELAEALRNKTYRADPIRRVYIPKADGKQRPLGIPTIKDRVVQTAAVLVLSPIFEADLQAEQYAYRPDRNAHDAVKAVHVLVNTGHTQVIDADLSGYFDTIPHAELMKSVARRISDRYMLRLIKMWLIAPVEETDARGGKRRTTPNKDQGRGTPQGAPISPLLANVYMRRFILGWKLLGYEKRLNAHIVNYADDYVICCRGTAQEATTAMRAMMEKLKLSINETKTTTCLLPAERFDFLGYTIGRCYSPKTGKAYMGTRPSKQAIRRICQAISEATQRRWLFKDPRERIAHLNRKLVGWGNYFCLGPVSKAYRSVDAHARNRLRWWLCNKHKIPDKGTVRFPDEVLYETLGLVRLQVQTHNLLWANA